MTPHGKPQIVFVFFLAAAILGSASYGYALKMEAHPIADLIEGDERTPPEGEHIVEERPATPAYPLANTSEFSQASAVETYPGEKETEGAASDAMEQEWDEWANWDEWDETDDWNSWNTGWDEESANPEPASDEPIFEETEQTASTANPASSLAEKTDQPSTASPASTFQGTSKPSPSVNAVNSR